MYGAAGESLYHYTTACAAFAWILPSRTLQLSGYRLMRDPLEAQPWTFGGSYSPDAIDDSSAVGRLSERIELANQVKDLAKLLSLSVDAVGWEEPFGRGYARGSLWELYAERHAGACLLFDGDRLIEVLMPQLEAHGDAFHDFVRYRRSPPASSFALDSGSAAAGATEDIRRHLAQHRGELFFTKLADWEGESEYRFVVIGGSGEYLRCSFEDSLRAVIVGEQFPDSQLEDAMRVTSEAGAEFRKLTWKDGFPRPAKVRR
jgi:hypothetical protein